MSKFLTVIYPFLSALLLTSALMPATAKASGIQSCRAAHRSIMTESPAAYLSPPQAGRSRVVNVTLFVEENPSPNQDSKLGWDFKYEHHLTFELKQGDQAATWDKNFMDRLKVPALPGPNAVRPEQLLHEDNQKPWLTYLDFNRPESDYPLDYYERFRNSMQANYRFFAFSKLYVPQFLNVPPSWPRRLNGSFISVDVTRKPYSLSGKRITSPEFEAIDSKSYFAEIIWRGDKEDPIFPSVYSPIGFLVDHWKSVYSTPNNIRNLIDDSLKRIYQSFAGQGPERQILVPIVQEQDRRDQERITHFSYGITNVGASEHKKALSIDEVGHMQIMTSTGPHQPFHFEEQWGKVERPANEVWGEGQRFILKPWEDLNFESKTVVSNGELRTLKYRLMHKAFAWANNDARLDRFIIQVNGRVRGILQEMGWPIEQAQATKKVQEINGEMTEEWLISFDKQLMLETEIRMMKGLLLNCFHRFADNPLVTTMSQRFDPNQVKTLIKMGLIHVSDKEPTPFKTPTLQRQKIIELAPDERDPSFLTISPEHMNFDSVEINFTQEMMRRFMAEWDPQLPSPRQPTPYSVVEQIRRELKELLNRSFQEALNPKDGGYQWVKKNFSKSRLQILIGLGVVRVGELTPGDRYHRVRDKYDFHQIIPDGIKPALENGKYVFIITPQELNSPANLYLAFPPDMMKALLYKWYPDNARYKIPNYWW